MSHIEDTIFDDIIPVNTIPVLRRIEEVMKERGTNGLRGISDMRIVKLIMLLQIQYFGSTKDNWNETWKEYYEIWKEQGCTQ